MQSTLPVKVSSMNATVLVTMIDDSKSLSGLNFQEDFEPKFGLSVRENLNGRPYDSNHAPPPPYQSETK
jgi:hypothetical protein